ncbi:hypothetical protein RJ639_015650 [Escallonia herrerae]|uniref:SHSP domain-containing protein n=1 Tax=Escallonia herrerae TaxID=1293975 RepID=A0AA88VEX1_9ASTE|nr:hypothetical protein RJ639_015650 [Escallonia herrerae]
MALVPSFFGGRRSNVFDPFSLDLWDPFFTSGENSAFMSTRVDWKETPEAHIFKADLPGLKKEQVKGRVLQISGERRKEQGEKNDRWHRVERSSEEFLRRFQLPENAKMDQVKASMENRVLTETVAKEEEKKPMVKAIDISERQFDLPRKGRKDHGRKIHVARNQGHLTGYYQQQKAYKEIENCKCEAFPSPNVRRIDQDRFVHAYYRFKTPLFWSGLKPKQTAFQSFNWILVHNVYKILARYLDISRATEEVFKVKRNLIRESSVLGLSRRNSA